MGRYYHLSKTLSDQEGQEIVHEMNNLSDIKSVTITPDQNYLMVVTKDNQFLEVMSKAVNICRHVSDCELTFDHFAPDI